MTPQLHPNCYPWHDAHTSFHVDVPELGVSVPEHYVPDSMKKDEAPVKAHPHTAAHGLPTPQPAAPTDTFSGGTAHKDNDQAGVAGSSKAYGRFAAPYGTVDPTSPSTLKFYPLEGRHKAADAQVAKYGYQHYYAGGKFAKPDLAKRNYNTKHLMIYDPEAGGGGDFGETSYTDAWRKTHELAHALTYPQLNTQYGEGRRIGSLGKQRTTREALRAVHWEWLAAHKQRELAGELGVHIPDTEFNKELNTVMHDAVHRAVTGKFTDPQSEGFRPHPHKVPLEQALGMVKEAAQQMGLKDEHSLLQKSTNILCPGVGTDAIFMEQETDMANDQATRKDITLGLAKALRSAITKAEAGIGASASAEARGQAKLTKAVRETGEKPKKPKVDDLGTKMAKAQLAAAKRDGRDDLVEEWETELKKADDLSAGVEMDKCGEISSGKMAKDATVGAPAGAVNKNAMSGYGPKSPGVGTQAPGMAKTAEPAEEVQPEPQAGLEQVATGCPACNGDSVEHLGDMGARAHFICKGCGMSFSHPREENAEATAQPASVDDPMAKGEFLHETLKDGVIGDATMPGAKLPEDKKSKEVDAEGSGGDVSKGKLQKDGLAPGKKTLMGVGGTPNGVGQISGRPGPHPDTAASLRAVAGAHSPEPHPDTTASLKALPRPGAPEGNSIADYVSRHFGKLPTIASAVRRHGSAAKPAFVKKPAADDKPAPASAAVAKGPRGSAAKGADLAADKKAGGVGFLNNLISRFRGTPAAPPAGKPSMAGAVRAMGARMALAEKKPDKKKGGRGKYTPNIDPKSAGPKGWYVKGALPMTGKAAAPKPPAAPAAKPGVAPVAKASISEVNKELAGFKSVASNPTAMPVGNKTGPAKPSAAPPSAQPPKAPKVK